jgi:hypothetical protein
MGETHSKPGFFQLGQLVTIKCLSQANSHDPEDPGIVIDTNDSKRAIVFNLTTRHVVLVHHGQLATTRFLAPLTYSMAEIVSEDILNHVREEARRRSEENRRDLIDLQDVNFPPLGGRSSPVESGQSSPPVIIDSESDISGLGTPEPGVDNDG